MTEPESASNRPPGDAIVVVGSLNVDYTLRVPHLPTPGETLISSGMLTCLGGKGANQAVAAARAGGTVSLIGSVGIDDSGTRYIEHLRREGINVAGILRSNAPTGTAFIAVDDHGENCIIVAPGANHSITPADIDTHATLIQKADILLLQLECPLAVVRRAAEIARHSGVTVVFNPSPWSAEVRESAIPVDVLIVNEHECREMTQHSVEALAGSVTVALQVAGCRMLVITRGGDSTLVLTADHGLIEIRPPQVIPIDTVGAGDTFAGAFATACASGRSLPDAIQFANTAAALATLQPGAQTAMPRLPRILEIMTEGRA